MKFIQLYRFKNSKVMAQKILLKLQCMLNDSFDGIIDSSH